MPELPCASVPPSGHTSRAADCPCRLSAQENLAQASQHTRARQGQLAQDLFSLHTCVTQAVPACPPNTRRATPVRKGGCARPCPGPDIGARVRRWYDTHFPGNAGPGAAVLTGKSGTVVVAGAEDRAVKRRGSVTVVGAPGSVKVGCLLMSHCPFRLFSAERNCRSMSRAPPTVDTCVLWLCLRGACFSTHAQRRNTVTDEETGGKERKSTSGKSGSGKVLSPP